MRHRTMFCIGTLGAMMALAPLVLPSQARAQDDDEDFDEDELVDAEDELEDEDPAEGDPTEGEGTEEGEGDIELKKNEYDPLGPEAGEIIKEDVRPPDLDTDAPLIRQKLFSTQFQVEVTAVFDYSYSNKFVSHLGGHLGLGFHIFDWVAVEAWGGGFYPQELAITRTVRQEGHSYRDLNLDPQLGDLWQTLAFGGLGLQWAPLYGKFSMFSEFDLSFQLYFVGGVIAELTARPQQAGQNIINNNFDFYPGIISGKQFQFMPRISAVYGAGVRIIPWRWVAFRIEARNITGPNWLPVSADYPELDITNLPLLNFGISLMFP